MRAFLMFKIVLYIVMEEMSFEKFLNDADILLVDNAFAFDINKWETAVQAQIYEEIYDDIQTELSEMPETFKYKLDEAKGERIIQKIKESEFQITDYWKTRQFLKKNNLRKEDLEEVLRRLEKENYTINSISEENEAIVFIKRSKVKNLGPFKLYIKLDYDSIELQPAIVISFHKAQN